MSALTVESQYLQDLRPEESNYEPSVRKLSSSETVITAEDEVVAIILAATMGCIVERWDFLCTEEKRIEDVPKKTRIKEDTICFVESTSEVNVKAGVSLVYASDSQLHNLSVMERAMTNKTDDKDFDQTGRNLIDNPLPESKELNGIESSLFNLSNIHEEEGKHQQQPLRSLFESQKEQIFGWSFLESDPEVIIIFKQGNRYEGKLSNCRMHGMGKFFWADGSVYKGEFCNGEMTGEGLLEWPDQGWYEGQLYRGLRHGLGLSMDNPAFYCGSWHCGLRQGLGAMFYNHLNTQKNYYNGEWSGDCKDGTGLRSYSSGALYSGQWSRGVRQGLGTMVWTNNDVYSGNWEEGQIHGYGEYTWDTFFNNQLAVPQENCYYGNWDKGIRHGNGTLETSLGAIVHGTWENGKKHGPAEVICSNGNFIYASNLFSEDCVSLVPEVSVENDSQMNESPQLYKVPVNSANHEIELGYYSTRLADYINECKRNGRSFGRSILVNDPNINATLSSKFYDSKRNTVICNYNTSDNKLQNDTEEMLLRNIILQYLSALKLVYVKYAELCCEVKPGFSSVLMRLMLWQLFRDCNLHKRGLSLADFDILIANNKATLVQGVHYPFERLQFWQFLHCMIEVSWELYGKQCDGTPSIQGVLASALHRLITSDIFPNAGRYKGNVLFQYKNLLSLDAIYWFYRGIGEPHSARNFLKNIFESSNGSFQNNYPDYPEHLLHGKNMIGVGGKLTYFPDNKPLIPNMRQPSDCSEPQDLTRLSGIGLQAVFCCLLDVCPSIAVSGLIVNMDYKIMFLEFYEILLLCANLNVKMKNSGNKDECENENLDNICQEKITANDEQAGKVEETPVTVEVSTKKDSQVKKKKKKK